MSSILCTDLNGFFGKQLLKEVRNCSTTLACYTRCCAYLIACNGNVILYIDSHVMAFGVRDDKHVIKLLRQNKYDRAH